MSLVVSFILYYKWKIVVAKLATVFYFFDRYWLGAEGIISYYRIDRGRKRLDQYEVLLFVGSCVVFQVFVLNFVGLKFHWKTVVLRCFS